MAAKLKAAYELIRKVQRNEITYVCDGKVPIDAQGTMALPLIPEREFVVEYMAEKKVTNTILKEFLLGVT